MQHHLILAICLTLLAATCSASIRGLNPELASHYSGEGGVFTCIDGSKSIPFTRVNDDYCDCPDGTDEPGTSACHNGRFYCQNLGHEPKLLSTSFVNDGVCDCCDGADETQGCSNTCLEKSKVHRENLQKQVDGYAAALDKKAQYIQQAQQKKADMVQRAQVIASEIDAQHDLITRLEAEKDAAEALAEAEALAAEEAKKAAEEQQQQQQEAVPEPAATPSEAEHHEERSLQEEPDAAEPEHAEGETAEETGRRIASQWTHDPESAIPEEGEDVDGTEHSPGYDEEEEEDTSYSSNTEDDSEDSSTNVGAARIQLREAEQKLKQLEKEKNDLDKYLFSGLDFGPDDVFLPLAGRCISGVQTRWTYEACMFDTAYQKEGYNNKVVIGRWKGYEENYTELVFTDGDYCHEVGNRSFRVTLSCGADEVLWDAEEPGTCAYVAKMTSPAVCSDLEYQHLKEHLKELEDLEQQIRLQIQGKGAKDEL